MLMTNTQSVLRTEKHFTPQATINTTQKSKGVSTSSDTTERGETRPCHISFYLVSPRHLDSSSNISVTTGGGQKRQPIQELSQDSASVIFVLIYFLVLVLVLVLPVIKSAGEDVLMICLNTVHH